MKRILILLLISGIVSLGYAQEDKKFDVYTDGNSPSNHYAPSGWMGDVGDLSLDDQNMEEPASGATCIKIVYSGKRTQGRAWAGIYWQSPPNNWGNRKGGFDLTGFNKLVFKARGQNGTEVINKVKVGGMGLGTEVAFPDSGEKEAGPIQLTSTWQEYSVNLAGLDLSYISGGFCVMFSADQTVGGATVYLDDIYYLFDPTLEPESMKIGFPFYVYADGSSLDNHYIPSGYMGDFGDVRINVNYKGSAYSGSSCMKVVYTAEGTQGARWSGIYWQNPVNNWGSRDGGFDLSGATKLTFWAKGENGGERIEEFKMGGIMGEYSDSDSAGIGPVVLTKDWKQYTIDLRGKDLSYVIGGFCWTTNADVNPEGATFYLDEIKYEGQ
ncbi:MAG: hypothetical protein JW734_02350 [Candidatus Omnitrophica bacterium]|nr:hypothetical protein [Candidatus Omnitrophota bacterium]